MAEDRSVTPEKQLLKLIEDSKAGGVPKTAQAIKRKGMAMLSPSALKGLAFGRFSFFKRTAKRKITTASRNRMSLQDLNRLMVLAIAGMVVYLIVDCTFSALNLKRPPNLGFKEEKSLTHLPGKVSPFLRDAEFYLSKVSARDIFREVALPKAKQAAAPAAGKPAEESVFRSLSLVGISWSSNPEIIIEDKKRKKTFFLHRGQVFGDNVKVEAIFKEKVVLSHEGEEFEMR